MISYMANKGTLSFSLKKILKDFEFIYHFTYFGLCLLGFFMHEFFYSLLVCFLLN